MPATIALCDHVPTRRVSNCLATFTRRGHRVTHVNNEDPNEVFNRILQLMPDAIILDILFEGKDDINGPLADWWGCRILGRLAANPQTAAIPVWLWSKHVSDKHRQEIHRAFGLPADRMIIRLATNHLTLAQTIEDALA